MKFPVFGTFVAFVYFTQPASSATATGTLNVSITIAAECTIALSSIDFGAHGVLTTDFKATGNIALTCSKGTAYSIAINGGLYQGASVYDRRMFNPAKNSYIKYGLFLSSARTTGWGDDIGHTYNGVASGNKVNLPIYALIPPQENVQTGIYRDTVSVTITY